MLAALTPSRLVVTFQAMGAMKIGNTDLIYLAVHSLCVPGQVAIPGAKPPQATIDVTWL